MNSTCRSVPRSSVTSSVPIFPRSSRSGMVSEWFRRKNARHLRNRYSLWYTRSPQRNSRSGHYATASNERFDRLHSMHSNSRRMNSKLPINLEDLLRQRTVEGDRIEYKAGWNPDAIVPARCARSPTTSRTWAAAMSSSGKTATRKVSRSFRRLVLPTTSWTRSSGSCFSIAT